VHAIATTYSSAGRGRKTATIRVSERLAVDARTMTGEDMTTVIRTSLADLGNLTYVDQYAFVVKARLEREARRAAGD
jgi:hypothetical protein